MTVQAFEDVSLLTSLLASGERIQLCFAGFWHFGNSRWLFPFIQAPVL